MTILVTGGAGFIGSALVRRLVSDGATVVTVDKLTYAGSLDALAPVMRNPRHAFVQVDVADAASMRSVFERHQPDLVLHLAAESHVDRSIDAPAEFVQTNLLGTFVLLQEARRHWRTLDGGRRPAFRLVIVSTDEVFGSLGPDGRFTADSPYRPTSPYAATKAGADHLAMAWHRTWGLPVVLTHCCNNYGPWQYPEKLIPLTILSALRERPLRVYGRGENVRDWIHVDDHVAALLAVAEKGRPGRRYLIGAGCERRNIDVIREIVALVDELQPLAHGGTRDALVRFVDDRPGHDRRYAVDPAAAMRELDWAPRIPFAAGLRSTVEWYLANREWCSRPRTVTHVETRQGLFAP